MHTATEELVELLSESSSEAVLRERNAFDHAAAPFGETMVLHGAGRFGRRTLAGMRSIGLKPIAFSDNNAALDATCVDGTPVLSAPRAAGEYGKRAAFAITIWNSAASDRMAERLKQLKDLGCERVFPIGLLYWKYPEVFLPYYALDLPHKVVDSARRVEQALQAFSDEDSRREFIAQVRFRLTLDYDAFGTPFGEDHYFYSDLFDLGPNEAFVDCGAFDGDTLDSFVRATGGSFLSAVAFEPDPKNLVKLEDRIDGFPPAVRKKIRTLAFALGSSERTVRFESTGTDTSKIGQGALCVQATTLDQALSGLQPTFIKFDIEGAELDALAGSSELISRCRPLLAVSCYHEQGHLWEIPLKLSEICPDYKFFLRPHGREGWDLLCYAIPVERLKHRM